MVHVEHLTKSIGNTLILSDICLDIAEGEVVGLLGPNGAGKSTLMKVLCGLWKANKGIVNVPNVGYLPEQNPLYPDMYVREYLAFMQRLKDQHRRKDKANAMRQGEIEQIIHRVGLDSHANKRIRELSKGYKQRVGLAQVLLGEPELLILDEPTTGLDPNQLEEIRALIKSLAAEHTIILSTHILQEVNAMCSRVIIIDHGQLKYDSPIGAIADLEQTFKQWTTDSTSDNK